MSLAHAGGVLPDEPGYKLLFIIIEDGGFGHPLDVRAGGAVPPTGEWPENISGAIGLSVLTVHEHGLAVGGRRVIGAEDERGGEGRLHGVCHRR